MVAKIVAITYIGGPKAKAKGMSKAVKASLKNVTLEWVAKVLPGHFRPGAAARYGFKPRTPEYIKARKRVTGGDQDLVFTGNTRDTVTQGARISGSAKKFAYRATAPWYVGMTKKMPHLPNLGQEIVTTNSRERQDMAKRLSNLIPKELERIKDEKVERVILA